MLLFLAAAACGPEDDFDAYALPGDPWAPEELDLGDDYEVNEAELGCVFRSSGGMGL